jgi:hypothetical protein
VLKNPEKGEDKMGRPRKCRPKKFTFSRVLQHCTSMVRLAGFLEKNQFPELIGPIQSIIEAEKPSGREVQRFLVKIKVPDFFGQDWAWLKFNASGSYVQISPDCKQWVDLTVFKVPKRFQTTG